MDSLSILIMAPVFNLQLLLDGVLVGAVFAFAAYGLALVWGVMNVKNLAQGDMVMMGGYIAVVMTNAGFHPILALPVAMVVLFAFGWLLYVLVIRRVIDRDLFTSLLATFGVAIVLQQALNLIFGPEVKVAESGFATHSFFDGGLTVYVTKVVSLGLVTVLAIGVVLFMKRSRMGQAIRATSQNARAARIMGIDTDRVYAFTFALNAAICGASGVLIAMIWVIQPFFGTTFSIRSFVIVTAAGLGNLPGVIAAGLGLGALEQFGSFILGAEFQQALVVGLLLAILGIRQIQQARRREAVR